MTGRTKQTLMTLWVKISLWIRWGPPLRLPSPCQEHLSDGAASSRGSGQRLRRPERPQGQHHRPPAARAPETTHHHFFHWSWAACGRCRRGTPASAWSWRACARRSSFDSSYTLRMSRRGVGAPASCATLAAAPASMWATLLLVAAFAEGSLAVVSPVAPLPRDGAALLLLLQAPAEQYLQEYPQMRRTVG